MRRQILWTSRQWPGCEHLDLSVDGDGVVADGLILAAPERAPIRTAYRIDCDPSWQLRSVSIDVHGYTRRVLTRDGAGRWFDDGHERVDLAGCTDVDIALTPFTNTLPIRRLALTPGITAELQIVYVEPTPEPQISAAAQRYTRLDSGYRYESGTFGADLTVDADGLVRDYPGLWVMAR